ncbi:unnamed protein product [Mycena citricolor]|uniref:Uncharacterized protein n=1 Tax=Mycena citricolor TaxID=2018698 RepID=A0AAD2HR53_9AGAR|nr:unnamed protein product [Mycena citricolor]
MLLELLSGPHIKLELLAALTKFLTPPSSAMDLEWADTIYRPKTHFGSIVLYRFCQAWCRMLIEMALGSWIEPRSEDAPEAQIMELSIPE